MSSSARELRLWISRQTRSDVVFASFLPVQWQAAISQAMRMVDVRVALLARFAGNNRIGNLISMEVRSKPLPEGPCSPALLQKLNLQLLDFAALE